jgi:16S rRNA (uracil1498-N3)-methyltransferase
MPRFFIQPLPETEDTVTLAGEDAAHISRSLRMREGDKLTLSDGAGTDYEAELLQTGTEVVARILSRSRCQAEPKTRLILFQAMPKGDKMELIVQKATELGVSVIQPILTSFCVSRPDAKSMEKKRVRYQKIAREAAGQSGRGVIPEVRPLLTLAQAAEQLPKKTIFFYEKGGERLCNLVGPEDTEIGLIVGSEGGFSPEEAAMLAEKGACTATLGPRILRCETAPLAGMSVILSLTGDI